MAILKAVIRTNDKKLDNKCNIKIRITHQRKVQYLSTDFYIEPQYFDNSSGSVKESYPNYQRLNINIKRLILENENRLLSIANVNNYDAMYLKSFLKTVDKSVNVFDYIDQTIKSFKVKGQVSSVESYSTLKYHLKRFHDGYLAFHEINYRFLTDWQDEMAKTTKEKAGLRVNSIAVMMRNLRAIYNKGINEGLVSLEYYPFRRFKIKSEKPEKRNLPAGIIHKIAQAELEGITELSRDMFMLSFYLCACNLIDLYSLRKSNVIMNRLSYRRKKTGQNISMKIQPEAQAIINKYSDAKDPYLIRVHKEYISHRNLAKRINNELEKIGNSLGVNRKVTFYFARHSFSTIGISIGINQDVIGKMLSHSSGKITSVYTEYDPEVIDSANRKIIDYVLGQTDVH